jgi:hypothetical protein
MKKTLVLYSRIGLQLLELSRRMRVLPFLYYDFVVVAGGIV